MSAILHQILMAIYKFQDVSWKDTAEENYQK